MRLTLFLIICATISSCRFIDENEFGDEEDRSQFTSDSTMIADLRWEIDSLKRATFIKQGEHAEFEWKVPMDLREARPDVVEQQLVDALDSIDIKNNPMITWVWERRSQGYYYTYVSILPAAENPILALVCDGDSVQINHVDSAIFNNDSYKKDLGYLESYLAITGRQLYVWDVNSVINSALDSICRIDIQDRSHALDSVLFQKLEAIQFTARAGDLIAKKEADIKFLKSKWDNKL